MLIFGSHFNPWDIPMYILSGWAMLSKNRTKLMHNFFSKKSSTKILGPCNKKMHTSKLLPKRKKFAPSGRPGYKAKQH
jgi:hypothetical protein